MKLKINDYDSLKIGDCFSLDINLKEYSNMQAVFIVMNKFEKNKHNKVAFTIKFIPKEVKEKDVFSTLLSTEFVKMKIVMMEQRFFPFDGQKSFGEHYKYIESKKCTPNEYGMIFDYNYIIIIDKDKKNLSNELKYLGNFRIPYPEDYFFSDIASYSNSKFAFLSEMDADALLNEVITSYENNNLGKDRLFDKIEAEEERKFWIETLKITALGDIYVPIMKRTCQIDDASEDSLTAVDE